MCANVASVFFFLPLLILLHLSLSLIFYHSFVILLVSPVPFCPGRRNTGRGACALAAATRYASVEFAILSRHVVLYKPLQIKRSRLFRH